MDWDYLFATALSTATVPTVGCYVQYLDRINQSIGGPALVPDDVLRRFVTTARTAGPPLEPDARFPRVWSAARLYWQNLRATLESGRWQSAARLTLVPVLAALTAGTRRAGTLA
jgi:hypothetical protein